MNYLGLIKNKAFLVHRRYVWAIKEKSVSCLKNILGLSFLHPETQSSHWVAISAEEKVAQLKEINNCDFTYDCFQKPEGEDRKGFPSPSNSNTALIRLSRINKLLNSVLSSLLWMIFERINVFKAYRVENAQSKKVVFDRSQYNQWLNLGEIVFNDYFSKDGSIDILGRFSDKVPGTQHPVWQISNPLILVDLFLGVKTQQNLFQSERRNAWTSQLMLGCRHEG